MNTKTNYTDNSCKSFNWLLAALALALTVPGRAETQPAAIPFSDIGARATANYQGDALGVTVTADGARLRCGFQKLEGQATTEGLWLESTKPGSAGRLRLTASALGRAGLSTLNPQPSTALAATGTVSVQDKLVRFTRPGLTEEYSVSVDGVRQDFIIESPPLNPQCSTLNQSAGDLRVELALSGAQAEASAGGAKLSLEGSGRTLAYNRLRVADATGRELTARLEVLSADRLAVSVADANAAYPVRIDPTFSDADWVSLNSGIPGANGPVNAMAVDGSGNLYVGGGFTLIGTVFANNIAKWDGNAWSALGSGVKGNVNALAVSGTDLYAGGGFTTAGGVPATNIAKWNGSAWSALGSGLSYPAQPSYACVYALAVSGTNLYVGGVFTWAVGVPVKSLAKWNGSAWSDVGYGVQMLTGQPGTVESLAVSGTNLYAGGSFDIAGSSGIKGIAKWDGSAWSALGSGTGDYVSALAVSGTNLYAERGGSIAKWNGSAWSALGSGIGGIVQALAVSGTNLYAGGYFTTAAGVPANCIAKWDGSAWSALGSGMNNWVYALAVSGTNLYAGGGFTTAGGVSANSLAKWDSSAWSGLGSAMGMGGYPSQVNGVNAVAVSGTNLYAGGTFATAGGMAVNSVAKWDGSAWSALGSGMGGSSSACVYALATSGTNLYAGGSFTTAGGVSATNIAKWDGSAWSALGSGMNNDVNALAVSGTNLYAGGTFTTAGGAPANYIGKWDGSTWSALGSGMNNSVSALAVSGANLYAGGGFYTAGGQEAHYIAKWNGSAWSALGSGMNNSVSALAVSGPNLYAAGSFRTAGGLPATYIAKWYGGAWSALGAGLNSGVETLLFSGTNLYAGGWFATAGGVPANYIATWDGSAWSPLGSGVDGDVNALAADGAGHLFVGGAFYLAGTNLSPYIAQANVGSAPANAPPVIFASPASLAVPLGATADFQVAAFGSPPLVYQWVFNGTTAVDGATSPFLSLANVQLTEAGAYSVTVSNLYGAVTSTPAVLMVTGVPPAIVASPVSLAVAGGATVDFQVEATGSPPLVYQWVFNGTTAIEGATSPFLSLANVQLTEAGAYSATVSNLYGAVTSASALLQVFPPGIVVTNCTEANLRAAMTGGGVVTFACDGTIFLANTITNVASGTQLDGSGHQVTITGGNGVRVFCINTNVTFTMVNLTIAGASSLGGSAILNLGGNVNLTGVTFRSNTATPNGSLDQLIPQASGGAIFNRGGTVNACNCSFVGNTAQIPVAYSPVFHEQVYGGAIRNESGQVDLRSCAFVGNRASGGAGNPVNSPTGDPGFGGAIHNNGTVTLALCTLTGNSASGGAGYGDISGYAGFPGGEGSGGAIFNQGTLTADRTTLSGNTATGGNGGVGQFGSTTGIPTLDGSDGGAGGGASGAAICNLGWCLVTRSTFASNVVTGGVGGAGGNGATWADGGGKGGRGAYAGSGLGGALFNSGAASLVNCTIALNTGRGGAGGAGGTGEGGRWGGPGGAGGNGGSGFGGVDGTCDLINCTVAWNLGQAGSGGAGGAAPPYNPGASGAPGTNGAAWGGTAYGPMANTLIASNTPAGGDSFTDPKLGPLADNGGPTLTMALLPGSPAIDAGNTSLAPATDQRGFPRPAGLAADLGAFEYGSVMPTIAISMPPPTQTAEAGATAHFAVDADGEPPLAYQWYFNGTNLLSCTSSNLVLTNTLFSQSGSYTVVVTNLSGAVTSAPAMLDVIAPVPRRLVPGVNLMAQAGNFLGLDYRDNLGPTANWATMATMTLSNSAQFYFDLSEPLPPQRFYRAWQTGTPSVIPSLSLPGLVPAITLTGNIGDSWRLDYINQFGPIDAWVTLATVTLTNTSQLYFDTSSIGQPARLWRIVPAP